MLIFIHNKNKMTQLNEIKRMQQLAGILKEDEAKVDTDASPMSNNKKNDLDKFKWDYAGSEKYDDKKKKYVLRANLNGKYAAYGFLDAPISEQEAKILLEILRDSDFGQRLVSTWSAGVKVEFQVVDVASNKVVNTYKLDVARNPNYAGWGMSSTHGTV